MKKEEPDTPDEFLNSLGESLTKKEGVDAELAEILKKYILVIAPGQNAITTAKDAIEKLAAKRAIPPQPGADNV